MHFDRANGFLNSIKEIKKQYIVALKIKVDLLDRERQTKILNSQISVKWDIWFLRNCC